MRFYNVFVAGVLPDGMRAYANHEFSVAFRTYSESIAQEKSEGEVWIFVNWDSYKSKVTDSLLLRRILGTFPKPRTIVMLDEANLEDGRQALSSGADGLIVGPLDRNRIIDRLFTKQLESVSKVTCQRLILGDLIIDFAAHIVRWKGKSIRLTTTEFLLLHHMASYPDRVMSRPELILSLGKQIKSIKERTIDIWIGRIRRALMQAGVPVELRTIRSRGYVLYAV